MFFLSHNRETIDFQNMELSEYDIKDDDPKDGYDTTDVDTRKDHQQDYQQDHKKDYDSHELNNANINPPQDEKYYVPK